MQKRIMNLRPLRKRTDRILKLLKHVHIRPWKAENMFYVSLLRMQLNAVGLNDNDPLVQRLILAKVMNCLPPAILQNAAITSLPQLWTLLEHKAVPYHSEEEIVAAMSSLKSTLPPHEVFIKFSTR